MFCDIVAKKIPATITYEDEKTLAFSDLHPQAPVHELVIPKKHLETIFDLLPVDQTLLAQLFQVAQQVSVQKGLSGRGIRLVTNVGSEAGQSVFHVHLHVLGGRAMKWPPG